MSTTSTGRTRSRMPARIVLLALVATLALPGAQAALAVVDSGIDGSHPELAGRVQRQSFAGPGVPGGLLSDTEGHGTAAASIAAGRTLGIARETQILDLQVRGIETGTAVDPATERAAQEALDWVLRQEEPPRVVLLSFAEGGLSEEGASTLAAQSARLWDYGVLVVVPMGDGALAAEPRVLTVGGASACRVAHGTDTPMKPDLRAPDQDLTAAAASPGTGTGGTTTVSGNAFAAAQAAGAAALILEDSPTMPLDAVTAILRGTATPGPACAVGILDHAKALAAAEAWTDPLDKTAGQNTPGAHAAVVVATLAVASVVTRSRRGP